MTKIVDHEPDYRSKPPGISIRRIGDLASYITNNGRPIFEHNAPQTLIDRQKARGVPFEEIACPYTDSRGAFPKNTINLSAMQEINKNRQASRDGFAWIRHHYFAGDPPAESTAGELVAIASIARALPLYLVLRGENDIPQEKLPNVVGDMTKAAEGIMIAKDKLFREIGENEVVDAKTIYNIANTPGRDGRSLLVDGRKSCAASGVTIVKTLGFMLYGTDTDPSRSELVGYIAVDEFINLKDFAVVVDEFKTASRSALLDLQRRFNIALGRNPDTLSRI